jgi:hypothetical protein
MQNESCTSGYHETRHFFSDNMFKVPTLDTIGLNRFEPVFTSLCFSNMRMNSNRSAVELTKTTTDGLVFCSPVRFGFGFFAVHRTGPSNTTDMAPEPYYIGSLLVLICLPPKLTEVKHNSILFVVCSCTSDNSHVIQHQFIIIRNPLLLAPLDYALTFSIR